MGHGLWSARAPVVLMTLFLAACTADRVGPWEPPGAPVDGVTGADLSERALLAGDRIPGDVSAVIVGLVAGAPWMGVVLAALGLSILHRRRARAERAASAAALADGPATVSGVVEAEAGATEPVAEARIHQRGAEVENKGTWSHQWIEVDRTAWARPFQIRCDDGGLVRVEPGERVSVRAAQAAIVRRMSRDARTRAAAVTPGMRVHVNGELTGVAPSRSEGVYRGGAPAVLRPPRVGPMDISTEPPGATAIARARFHARWAAVFAVLGLVLAGAVLPTFLVLAVDGEPVRAVPIAVQRREVWHSGNKGSRGYWEPRYRVRARAKVAGAAVTLQDDCGSAVHECVRKGRCDRIAFVVATHAPSFHMVGLAPTIGGLGLSLLLIPLVMLLMVYPSHALHTRPWYRKPNLTDYGAGKLG